ncbi:DNA-dependent metalloprotease SPRTN [Cydia pomonella]|uniref:DNA-dependent metalloprotease SPRTN n=1 Tax=Cydia pomonella TaxID=82600 RepID=UPI002ADD81EF|nr:DNA-dependent metalloprotease SPRTN [Cydia pomonella]
MNLGDPELELIDPTPNVHALFTQFDRTFFWAKLASRAVVRWSKRMYSCAGICSYEGRGGLCDIALSEPLLKLRPRKDLVETLLHEMIHAYLFITQRDQDRDGHGPNFKEHMYRINMAAGINISIYHDFHDEVKLYQTHWWRCNGPCQLRKPYFGIVRRTANVAPGPRDRWWTQHQKSCGGTFIKIKEPDKNNKKTPVAQPKGDITKYITSNKKTTTGDPKIVQITDIKSSTPQAQTKSNNSSTIVVTQKDVSNPLNKPAVKPPSFVIGKYYTIGGTSTRVRSNSVDAAEAVRNVWAKKQLTQSNVSPNAAETVRNTWAKKQLTPASVSPIAAVKEKNINHVQKPNTLNIFPKKASTNMNNNDLNKKVTKHKTHSEHVDSPPGKVKKIDDYFKKNATSLLKDIYGTNIEVVESNSNNKLVAVNNTSSSSSHTVRVECPICGLKIEEQNINNHLDECLNKDLISKICSGNETAATSLVKTKPVPLDNNKDLLNPTVGNIVSKQVSKDILATLQTIPPYKPKQLPELNSEIKMEMDKFVTTFRGTFWNETQVINKPNNLDDNIDWNDHLKAQIPKIKLEPIDLYNAESVVKKVEFDKPLRKSDNYIVPKEEKGGSGDPFIVEDAKIKLPVVKKEPGNGTVSVLTEQNCPCCGNKVTKPMDEHLDECLAFFATDTAPEEASTSFANQTIVIDNDDDDVFDESQVFNATGTKLPCPCCMQMVENDDMNAHLDSCLS